MARSKTPRDRARFGEAADVFGLHSLTVAAVMIGAAGIGAVASDSASSKAQESTDNATAAQGAAARDSTGVARERLDFEKQQYADGKGARDTAAATANQVSQAQLASQKQSDDLAKEYNEYRKTTFQPLEQQIVREATAYDTPDRRTAAATSATADVDMGFARSADANARRLAANGINPGSARAVSAMGGSTVEQAKASAGAAYMARKGVEDTGIAMKTNAVSLGRNLPANQNASANTAINAGNSAVNNSTVPVSVNQTPGSLSGAYAGLSSAYQGAASTFGSQASNYQSVANAGNAAWGQLGSVGGQIGARYFAGQGATPISSMPTNAQLESQYGFSDEELKTGIKPPVTDEQALQAVNATPVSGGWKYDPAKMAANGIDMPAGMDGEQQGAMAQDVNRTMGEGAAPGGKIVNHLKMNAVTMRGLQAVDKKMGKLEKQVASIASMVRSGRMEARTA